MMALLRFCVSVLFLLAALPAIAEIYISVAPLTLEGVRDLSGGDIRDLVAACFSSSKDIAVVERADVTALTAEAANKMTGFAQGSEIHMKGVNYVVTGSVTAMPTGWLVSLQANDPSTTQLVAAHSGMIDLDGLANKLCENIVAPFGAKLLHTKPHRLHNAAIENEDESQDEALTLQGISYAKSGAYDRALPLFMKVLRRNPAEADAKYWLAISYARSGLKELAKKEATEAFRQFPTHPQRPTLEAALKNSETEKRP